MTLLYFANGIKKRAVIPTERTPGANGGICSGLIQVNMNLAESQIPPLRNWTIPLSPLSPKGKGDYLVFGSEFGY